MATDTSRPFDDLDDFDLGDLEDDPFRSPSPQPEQSQDKSKKRKSDGLGIDEEIDVNKRVRVPRIKLDEGRLLSEDGIPKLRKRAGNLKFKGKGHEFSDAARLLSFYQFWLDDLFPKAKFLDALGMVEKAGHKRTLALKRTEWIDEGKPKSSVMADDGDPAPEEEAPPSATTGPSSGAQVAPSADRPQTPDRNAAASLDEVPPDDDDLYNATPVRARTAVVPIRTAPEEDDPDDLDALMAEAEMESQRNTNSRGPTQKAAPADDDDDDLDALMAEAEAETRRATANTGNQAPEKPAPAATDDDFADDEAAMAEMGGLW